jgi:Ca-activated chloride channel family protein
VPDALTKIRLPLAGVGIKAKVADRIATVEVHQSFVNDHKDAIECTYVFPLSGGCAVSDFEMRVGTRIIKGIVEERARARAAYQKALNEGKRAALLEQERDDVFTVQVGNIPPGEEVSVVLTYSEKLAFFEDGRTEIMLPLVVAPRYITGDAVDDDPSVGTGTESDTDVVPDASRITPPRLVKGFDPQTALNIEVEIATADQLIVEDISCSQHATKVAMSADALKIGLSRSDELTDRDFVLSWRMASSKIVSNLLTFTAESGDRYGMLSILPPASEVVLTVPRDIVFVLDRSGSMEGEKMVWAARSCANLIATLRPTDRFAIAAFDNVIEWYNPHKVKNGNGYFAYADEAGIALGCDYLRTVTARGGTEMYWALDHALNELFAGQSNDTGTRIPVVVMLTDGDVGDESRIFGLIQKRIGDARLFTIGVDSAVNTGLLRRVAQLGGGTATFVQPGAQIEEALRSVAREIGPPVLTDISIDDAGKVVHKDSVTPQNLPDVFAGRASCVFLKLTKKGTVKIKGTLPNGKTFEEKVSATAVKVKAISQLWAKSRITDMEDQMRMNPKYLSTLRKDLIALSIEHCILTRFTAFVAVDHTEIANETGKRLEITQPVQEPAGWEELADKGFGAGYLANKPGQAPLNLAQRITRSMGSALSADADDQIQTGSWNAPAGGAAFGSTGYAGNASWGAPPAGPPAAPAPSAQPSSYMPQSSGELEEDRLCQEAPQSATPFSAGQSSYGSGVRSQVFEVIVRQAMAGVDYENVCAGPMQVNNISREEVEQEVSRRQALLNQSPAPKPPTPPTPTKSSASAPPTASAKPKDADVAQLPADVLNFLQALQQAWKDFQDNKPVDASLLEQKRQQALTQLTSYKNADKVPQLQTFLRGAAVELINSLRAKGATPDNIRPLWEGHIDALNQAMEEATNFSKEKRFWEMFF